MSGQIHDLPVGWWVVVSLPDGRLAIADGEDPEHRAIVKIMRKVLARRAQSQDGEPGDYAKIAAWLDQAGPPRGR